MTPLTQHNLAHSAYRTLGLSALADPAQIENAARRMRIWPSPDLIPPTPWDLPHLGPLPRSKTDIEHAVSRLAQPESRIEERLRWFHTDAPPAKENGAEDSPPAVRHAAALLALQTAWAADPAITDSARWQQIMQRLTSLSAAPDFGEWLLDIEAAGDFDKRASREEILAAAASLPAALSAALLPKAQAAIEAGHSHAGAAILAILHSAGPSEELDEGVSALLDNLEDNLAVSCREMDGELRDKLRTNHATPEPFFGRNLVPTKHAASYYEAKIAGPLSAFADLSASDPGRLLRTRSKCAGVLSLLALGWEWSGKFDKAENTLLQALSLAEGTVAEPSIRADHARVRAKVIYERKHRFQIAIRKVGRKLVPKRTASKGKTSNVRWVWLLAVIGSALARLLTGPSTNRDQTNPLPPQNYDKFLDSIPQTPMVHIVPHQNPTVPAHPATPSGNAGTRHSTSFSEVNREP